MFGCCKIFFCFPARCGWADHTGSTHWRLWGSCGALSPWQPNGRQHYIGHCRRGRALRENPEEVFCKNSQQDNQGNDQETFYWEFMNWEFIIDDIIMFLSCSWSARWWWKTGMTSWRRVTCRTGRRLWLLLWPTLSLRSSHPSVVSWRTQDMQPVSEFCHIFVLSDWTFLFLRPSRGQTGGSRRCPTASPGLSVLHLCWKRGEACILLDQSPGRTLSPLSSGRFREWLQLCILNLQPTDFFWHLGAAFLSTWWISIQHSPCFSSVFGL